MKSTLSTPRSPALALARAATALALAFGLAACSGDGPSGPDTTVATVVVTAPATSTMETGATMQLSARAQNAAGAAVAGKTFAWASSSTDVATVDGSGMVTAVTPGAVTITATESESSKTASVQMTVIAATVNTVAVSPPSVSVFVGETRQLSAELKDARGVVLSGRTVAWTTADAAVATVDAAGLVTAVGPGGPVAITATAEGKTATSQVTVQQAPVTAVEVSAASAAFRVRTTTQVSAVARGAAGGVLTGRAVTWTSSDTLVARVDASGSVVGVSAGTATITGTVEGQQGSAAVTVQPGALPIRGLYVSFDRPNRPNGYYSGDAIKWWNDRDEAVGTTVRAEIGRQMDAIRALGVNTITFELRTSDATLIVGPPTPPVCNVSPSVGLLYPQPPAADLDNLAAFFDMANGKGLKVMLRLVNTRMDEQYRAGAQTWLGAILNRVKSHPALELVLFEGDVFLADSNGDGTVDSCGHQAEPPLYLGPDRAPAKYVEWAIGYGRSLGIPARKLSAQAVIGNYNIDTEGGAGSNAQNNRLWHTVGVLKTIFDRLNIPEAERTYAISMYTQRRCLRAVNACTDAPPAVWLDETVRHAMARMGHRSPARMVAVEMGAETPLVGGWTTEAAMEAGAVVARKYGLSGVSFWRWVNYTAEEDANANLGNAIKRRGPGLVYTPAKDALVRMYAAP